VAEAFARTPGPVALPGPPPELAEPYPEP
jgi:hypothetical protein